MRYLSLSETNAAYLDNRLSMALLIVRMDTHSRNSGRELVQIDRSWAVEACARGDPASVPSDGSESPASHPMSQFESQVLDDQSGTPDHAFV